jgi:hypothetical protein
MTKRIVFGAALALVIVGLMARMLPPFVRQQGHVDLQRSHGRVQLLAPSLTGPARSSPRFGSGRGRRHRHLHTTARNANRHLISVCFRQHGLSYDLSDACVQPQSACATGQIAVMATVLKGGLSEFLTTQAPETPGGNVTFVTATQLIRLLLVLIAAPLIASWLTARRR